MVSIRVWVVVHVIVAWLRIAHSVMIIQVTVDVSLESLDECVIDVCLDIGIIHPMVVYLVHATLTIPVAWDATLKMDSE